MNNKQPTTADEFLRAAASSYEGTTHHLLPIFFTNLFRNSSRTVVIARGPKRNEIKNKLANMRKFCNDPHEVHYEPNYDFLRHSKYGGHMQFITTGPVAMNKLNSWIGIDDVLLYGFDTTSKDFDILYNKVSDILAKDGVGKITIVS